MSQLLLDYLFAVKSWVRGKDFESATWLSYSGNVTETQDLDFL
jgi:hypothetical protein